jgi:predicted MFS family arabinose efflux permease
MCPDLGRAFSTDGEDIRMGAALRWLMWLVGLYYFLQGVGGNPGLYVQALQKHVKEVLRFSPAESAGFFAFLTVPWMIKPLYGLLSDFFPLFGWRRRSYFVLVGGLSAAAYGLLSFMTTSQAALLALLFAAAVGFAFSDVLCDAVMVEQGQPLRATDRLQAAQWAANGIAGIVVAVAKGYLAEHGSLAQALRLTMLAPLAMVALTLLALPEAPAPASREAAQRAWQGLKRAAGSKPLWAAAAFLFLYDFSPNLGSVLYYYEKDVLGFSDVLIGYVDTVGAVGFVLGTILFGLLAPRLSHEGLLRAVVVSGVVSTLGYLLFRDAASALAVTLVASAISAIAFLGPLTIAAKICPPYAEGTVFALLMSVLNAGTQLGSITGGKLYEALGYTWLVVIAAAFTAAMWFFLPLVRERPTS